jgi:hypothetical protein
MSAKKNNPQAGVDGLRVERTVRDGRVVDTTYDADGNVVDEVMWAKGWEPAEPRVQPPARGGGHGPLSGHGQRPL